MDDLVQRLSQGRHHVEVALRPEKTVKAFRDCISRGYVHLRFSETRGGTELGVNLDENLTDLSDAQFDEIKGMARLVGSLTLNYVRVRCSAEIDLSSLEGSGYLEPLA
jgi:hypothetical protein